MIWQLGWRMSAERTLCARAAPPDGRHWSPGSHAQIHWSGWQYASEAVRQSSRHGWACTCYTRLAQRPYPESVANRVHWVRQKCARDTPGQWQGERRSWYIFAAYVFGSQCSSPIHTCSTANEGTRAPPPAVALFRAAHDAAFWRVRSKCKWSESVSQMNQNWAKWAKSEPAKSVKSTE